MFCPLYFYAVVLLFMYETRVVLHRDWVNNICCIACHLFEAFFNLLTTDVIRHDEFVKIPKNYLVVCGINIALDELNLGLVGDSLDPVRYHVLSLAFFNMLTTDDIHLDEFVKN